MKVKATQRSATGKAPHAGISSDDETYKALGTQIAASKDLKGIVDMLGRGQGSNTVRFAMAFTVEALRAGVKPVLTDSEFTVELPEEEPMPIPAPKPAR